MSLPTQPAPQPHHNHGLFSDHYLDVTLPKRQGWRSMVEQAQPVMEEISRLFASFTPSTNEAQTEEGLVKPILRLLGHDYEVQPALETPDGPKRPDYVLYRDADAVVANKDLTLTEECQAEKVIADMGEEEGADYIGDILEKSLREDGPTVQVVLWREGYTCEEWGNNWSLE